MLKKIISGGHTGADYAGLDIAIEKGIPLMVAGFGWIPVRKKNRGWQTARQIQL